MLTSGFTHAPVSKVLLIYVIAASIVANVTDSKYLLPILVEPHLWSYGQLWRLLTWQTCYLNSTEVLFAGLTIYNLRIIERLWGSRKFASFLLTILPYTTLLAPVVLTVFLRPLTFSRLNYLPAGPTPILFAILAQYHAIIPPTFTYRLTTSSSAPAITLTSKSTTYMFAIQLAFSQFPHSFLPAIVGFVTGHLWRAEVLPPTRWRIPGWLWHEDASERERYEGLRRRLEDEVQAGAEGSTAAVGGSGAEAGGESAGARRRSDESVRRRNRGFAWRVVDQFRGAF